MTDPVVVLDGNRFYVGDPGGDAGSGSEGFYADDVRVLRRWALTVDGQRPVPLGGGPGGAHHCWSGYGILPGLLVRRQLRVSRAGLRETLSITHSGPAGRRVRVRYAFDADFLDLFEVKERELGKPLLFASALPPTAVVRSAVDGVHRFAGSAGRWRAAVDVDFSPPGEPAGDGITVTADLAPRTTWTLEARILLVPTAPTAAAPAAGVAGARLRRAEADAEAELAEWRRTVPTLTSPSAPLQRTYRKSVADLAALRMPTSGGLLPAAGLPWFMTVFGRDTLLTCLLTMALGQDQSRAALRTLAALQSGVDDPGRDAEPGKIPHEVRAGKLAALGTGLPYYGSVDATPLYLMLAAETWRWTGDDELVRELEPILRAAMGWVEGPADLSGRGYVEFRRRSGRGLAVQSWKDSATSMLFADGSPARAPLAVCEVQGYAYAARLGMAEIARAVWRDGAYADRLEAAAAALRDRVDRDFWVDTPAGGHYALALDADGRRVDALTSDVGQLLWTGILTGARAERTADVLLGPELFSGWGVRTMSTGDAGYDPVGYHVGTVWPHDTAIACAGLARHGRRAAAVVLLRALVDAAARLDWRLPEVLAGLPRAETGFPVVYPTSCSPQAWASAAPIGGLTAILGLRPDRAARRLTAAASVPADLDVTLRGVPALGRRWDVTARAGTTSVVPAGP